jgi:preprotein translocase SecE subunit
LAKTIDKAKNAARSGSKRAVSDTAPEELLDEETPLDSADATPDGADEDVSEEEDLSLAVDPTARQEDSDRALATSGERGATPRSGSGGIYVPAALMGNPFTRWLAESYIELRKVTWPEPREAWNMTLVVIAVSVIMSLLLAAADFGLGHLLSYFVSLGLGK